MTRRTHKPPTSPTGRPRFSALRPLASLSLLALFGLGGVACDDDSGPAALQDAGPLADAQLTDSALDPDLGAQDAGARLDAQPPREDAGEETDAALEDAGPGEDATPHEDGGPIPDDGGPIPDDGGPGPDDGGPGQDDGGPGQDDGGPGEDAGELPAEGSIVAPLPEVIRAGEGGFLLRAAVVLGPNGPIYGGSVLTIGSEIRCVGLDCEALPEAQGVTVIDTQGTVSPGLIDAHNHVAYNYLGEWVPDPPRLFDSRYQWRNVQQYKDFIQPNTVGGNSGAFICPASKWGELRSLVHATTTMQGQSANQSCIDRLVRNADHHHGLGPDHVRTNISGPCEAGLNDAARVSLVEDFRSGRTTRFFVHMAEGVAGSGRRTNVHLEFACYAGTAEYETSLLYDTDGTPFETSVLIHAVSITGDEVEEAVAANARFVWSPSSNLVLYGATAPIEEIIEAGGVVALGPDWTLSGEDDMLAEMRFALAWARAEGVEVITPERLVRMATEDGAEVVGLDMHIGRLHPGMRADLAVFGRLARDPYEAVVDSHSEDVRLVLIDGQAYYGDAALQEAAALNELCEPFDTCGHAKFLCAAGTPGNPNRAMEAVADIEAQLLDHLATFERDDLLPLTACTVEP